jgi:hypothetical protein
VFRPQSGGVKGMRSGFESLLGESRIRYRNRRES